ncbi:type II toxin-antitoxin system Phd/YefM family antitoxin [Paraburkholderia sp. BCC1886]|uniref:type II toxin-antitoxin system Phd/YefM family antitoxin n=1 Tax=Paraburkholderia sp. BCC1886 TaxID=2562670 RepID=UPI001181DFD4|nr:type II toxin-antitoxin system prevent-host-death family antitoxin [Paraburkholderia sp. BCC1886]
METILTDRSVGISELKANPNVVIEHAAEGAIAVLNRNKPVAYLLTAERYEALMDRLEDYELGAIARERMNETGGVEVSLDDL